MGLPSSCSIAVNSDGTISLVEGSTDIGGTRPSIAMQGAEVLGPHLHPEITLHTFPLGEYMSYSVDGRWKEMGQLLLRSAEKLARAGADFLICPDNTIHQALDQVREDSQLPWLHIAEVVASEAAERGVRRLGILGTRNLMEGPVYPPRLAERGIAYRSTAG